MKWIFFSPDTSNAQCAAVSKLLSQGYISDTVVRRALTNGWRGGSFAFFPRAVPPTIDRYFVHLHQARPYAER